MAHEKAPESPAATTEVPALERTTKGRIVDMGTRMADGARSLLARAGLATQVETMQTELKTQARAKALAGNMAEAAEDFARAGDMASVRVLLDAAAQAPNFYRLQAIASAAGVVPPRDLCLQAGENALKYNFPNTQMAYSAFSAAGLDEMEMQRRGLTSAYKPTRTIGNVQYAAQEKRLLEYVQAHLGS